MDNTEETSPDTRVGSIGHVLRGAFQDLFENEHKIAENADDNTLEEVRDLFLVLQLLILHSDRHPCGVFSHFWTA